MAREVDDLARRSLNYDSDSSHDRRYGGQLAREGTGKNYEVSRNCLDINRVARVVAVDFRWRVASCGIRDLRDPRHHLGR